MGPHQFNHYFDGYAKVNSWRFPGDGEAYFTSRFISSQFYKVQPLSGSQSLSSDD